MHHSSVDVPVRLSLAVQTPLRAGASARWELRLENDGVAPVLLRFRTSQRGDVALEQDGVERWRWSDGMMFLQVLGERELAPGEVWLVELEGVVDVEPGEYEAVATVASEPALPPRRLHVVVE
jgi:hypothetical protein